MEDRFLKAFRLHRSGVRFLSAGFFADAIHTIIQGLETMDVTLEQCSKDSSPHKHPHAQPRQQQVSCWRRKDISDMSSSSTTATATRKQLSSTASFKQNCESINRKPLDHTCYTNEEWMTPVLQVCCKRCEPSLIAAMIYNLALSYHLYALGNETGDTLIAYLKEALRLYHAADSYLRTNAGLGSCLPIGLEKNVRQIQWVIAIDERNTTQALLPHIANATRNGTVEAQFF